MTSVKVTRASLGRYVATNSEGATVEFGQGEDQFSAVELLLAALGGCTGIDVDYLTSRRAEPDSFEIEVSAQKVSDGTNHLEDVSVTFRLRFPEGVDGDRAREALPTAVQRSHDRLCTVGRTIELPTPITTHLE
jgi:putative redox protein